MADLLFKPGRRFNCIFVIRINDKGYLFINSVVSDNANLGRCVRDMFDANVDSHLFQLLIKLGVSPNWNGGMLEYCKSETFKKGSAQQRQSPVSLKHRPVSL
jgi:hypothetical protein